MQERRQENYFNFLGLRVTREISVMDLLVLGGLVFSLLAYHFRNENRNDNQDDRIVKLEARAEKNDEDKIRTAERLDTRMQSMESLLYRIAGKLDVPTVPRPVHEPRRQ